MIIVPLEFRGAEDIHRTTLANAGEHAVAFHEKVSKVFGLHSEITIFDDGFIVHRRKYVRHETILAQIAEAFKQAYGFQSVHLTVR